MERRHMSNDEEVMESVRGIFIAECGSALEDAKNSLLRLEQNPADAHELTVLFRIAHTFKGSAL